MGCSPEPPVTQALHKRVDVLTSVASKHPVHDVSPVHPRHSGEQVAANWPGAVSFPAVVGTRRSRTKARGRRRRNRCMRPQLWALQPRRARRVGCGDSGSLQGSSIAAAALSQLPLQFHEIEQQQPKKLLVPSRRMGRSVADRIAKVPLLNIPGSSCVERGHERSSAAAALACSSQPVRLKKKSEGVRRSFYPANHQEQKSPGVGTF